MKLFIEFLLGSIYFLLFAATIATPFAGVGLLIHYEKDRFGQLAGYFLLKQVVDNPFVWLLIFSLSTIRQSWDRVNGTDPVPGLTILPAVFLTLILILLFRDLFKSFLFPWLLVFGDFLRWLAAYIFFSALDGGNDFLAMLGLIFLGIYPLIVALLMGLGDMTPKPFSIHLDHVSENDN